MAESQTDLTNHKPTTTKLLTTTSKNIEFKDNYVEFDEAKKKVVENLKNITEEIKRQFDRDIIQEVATEIFRETKSRLLEQFEEVERKTNKYLLEAADKIEKEKIEKSEEHKGETNKETARNEKEEKFSSIRVGPRKVKPEIAKTGGKLKKSQPKKDTKRQLEDAKAEYEERIEETRHKVQKILQKVKKLKQKLEEDQVIDVESIDKIEASIGRTINNIYTQTSHATFNINEDKHSQIPPFLSIREIVELTDEEVKKKIVNVILSNMAFEKHREGVFFKEDNNKLHSVLSKVDTKKKDGNIIQSPSGAARVQETNKTIPNQNYKKELVPTPKRNDIPKSVCIELIGSLGFGLQKDPIENREKSLE